MHMIARLPQAPTPPDLVRVGGRGAPWVGGLLRPGRDGMSRPAGGVRDQPPGQSGLTYSIGFVIAPDDDEPNRGDTVISVLELPAAPAQQWGIPHPETPAGKLACHEDRRPCNPRGKGRAW